MTREKILEAGLKCWPDLKLSNVAAHSGVAHHQNILYYFPHGTLRDAVADHAVRTGCSRVIVHLIAEGHRAVKNMSQTEKNKHFKAIQTC